MARIPSKSKKEQPPADFIVWTSALPLGWWFALITHVMAAGESITFTPNKKMTALKLSIWSKGEAEDYWCNDPAELLEVVDSLLESYRRERPAFDTSVESEVLRGYEWGGSMAGAGRKAGEPTPASPPPPKRATVGS